jgi:hypothetical protein
MNARLQSFSLVSGGVASQYRYFLTNTKGTPHRGSETAVPLRRMIKITGISGFNNALLDALSKDSATMQFTNESWMHLQPTYEIYSFYETLASPLGTNNTVVKSLLHFRYCTLRNAFTDPDQGCH